MNWHDGLIVS